MLSLKYSSTKRIYSDVFIDTNPFSSFRCWYSSALLLTEFKRPINSWCFLELAVLILLLHKVNKDIGPKIANKKRLSDLISEFLNIRLL